MMTSHESPLLVASFKPKQPKETNFRTLPYLNFKENSFIHSIVCIP